jgi:excisionase family DNA binding protein
MDNAVRVLMEESLAEQGKLHEQCYTVRNVANMWDVSVRTVQRMVIRGELRALKLGRAVRIPSSALACYQRQEFERMKERARRISRIPDLQAPAVVQVENVAIHNMAQTPSSTVSTPLSDQN